MRPVWIGVMVLLPVLAIGCESTSSATTSPDSLLEIPTYTQIVEAHNNRVSKLRQTYSYGVLELKWEDERGSHSEPQVEIDLWLDLPDRTALRVTKLGDVYFWIGSDEHDYWVFNLLNRDDKRAVIRSRDDDSTAESMASFGINPESLLDLMALRPIAEVDGQDSVAVEEAEAYGAWSVSELGVDGTTRMFFEKGTLHPVRVELRSPEGELLVISTLSRYESVFVAGEMILSYPKSAMWIDIVDVVGNGFAKLHLNEMTTDVPERQLGRVFDIERLLGNMKPHDVEGSPQAVPDPAHQ